MKILALVLCLLALAGCAFSPISRTVDTKWEGTTDLTMLNQVRAELEYMRSGDTLRVTLLSPGGPVITSLEIARLVRQASERGVIVEIHAVALCASGCTFVLASGTPGHRYISEHTLYLVHPIQQSSFMSASCVDRKMVSSPSEAVRDAAPKPTEEAKVINALYDAMVAYYVAFSGRPAGEVESWLRCGNEQAGGGALAVALGLADRVG